VEITDENFQFGESVPLGSIRRIEFLESFFDFGDLEDKADIEEEEEIFSKKNVPLLNQSEVCKECERYVSSLEFFDNLEAEKSFDGITEKLF
jgi:hypothetical protein